LDKIAKLTHVISEGMRQAKSGALDRALLFSETSAARDANEYCFFLKPGSTDSHPQPAFRALLERVLARIFDEGFVIAEVHVLSSRYLAAHRIMHQHYGVLTQWARNASVLPSDAAEHFRTSYGVEPAGERVLGAYQALAEYEYLTTETLGLLWDNVPHVRLASGIYCARVRVENADLYLINGFTPRQLDTYYRSTHALVVYRLRGNVQWEHARTMFLGSRELARAHAGSLRRWLFENGAHYALRNVSQAGNGCHLSAGPVEALVELRRFHAELETGSWPPLEDFAFGRALHRRFRPPHVDAILSNSTLELDGVRKTVFDATEGLEPEQALELLARARWPRPEVCPHARLSSRMPG
jgi:hypothetical protein